MRDLIIIGNGFDLAHDLHTRYSDFLEFVWGNAGDFYEQITKYICEDDLWNDFENALGSFDDGGLKEMSDSAYLNYDRIHSDYRKAISDELTFSTQISGRLCDWIKNVETKARKVFSSGLINNENKYLNFNYTDTLESNYDVFEQNICYLHGKVSRNDGLVIGHRNVFAYTGKKPLFLTYEEEQEWFEYQMNRNNEDAEKENRISIYFSNTYKDTETIIAQNEEFFKSLQGIKNVYIIGHSLSAIDFPYFQEVHKNVSTECCWHITYHSLKDKRNANDFLQKMNITNYQISRIDEFQYYIP